MLNTFNLCSTVCQLYLDKTRGKTQNKKSLGGLRRTTQMEKFYKKQIIKQIEKNKPLSQIM